MFWSSVNLEVESDSKCIIISQIYNSQPRASCIFIQISIHTATQTHICSTHNKKTTLLSSGTLTTLLLIQHTSCVLAVLFWRIKKKRINASTAHGSVSGSHSVPSISECGVCNFLQQRFMVLTAMQRCEEGYSEVRRLITCESPLS